MNDTASGPLGSARMGRRALLAAAAAGMLTAWMTGPALAKAGDGSATVSLGAGRRSRIIRGTTLVHADLHNHTLLSDGDGNPEDAFVSMRAAGLDVAALTDHATLSDHLLGDAVTSVLPPGTHSSVGSRARAGSGPECSRTPRTAPVPSPHCAGPV